MATFFGNASKMHRIGMRKSSAQNITKRYYKALFQEIARWSNFA